VHRRLLLQSLRLSAGLLRHGDEVFQGRLRLLRLLSLPLQVLLALLVLPDE
jgi:hypothetical protein